jgi:hypothetical protein
MSVENLSDTIAPKSDQLNADDLLTGPITIKIKDVRRGSKDQPVFIDIEGRQPYKPCKTMRRVLVTAWGQNGKEWVGRSITVYCDPSVKFGGVALGGIRISHLSNIDKTMNMMLTASRGKKVSHTVNPIVEVDYSVLIEEYKAIEGKDEKQKLWDTLDPKQRQAILDAYNGE